MVPGAADPAAERLRAGGRALLLLADPVSVAILCSLASRSMESAELIDKVENVSRSTCFDRLRDLEEISLIARERRAGTPPVAICQLTGSGRRLLFVAGLLEAWLARAPDGPLALGDPLAAVALKALAFGWGSTLIRWLAERPRSLTELESLVEDFGYRKVERTARDLVDAGLAERVDVKGRLNPYSVTPWARESVAPLIAAVCWERREIPDRSAFITPTDAEGGLLLALPLTELRERLDGACFLLVDTEAHPTEGLGAVATEVVGGRPASWAPGAEGEPGEASWVRGTASAWMEAMADGGSGRLDTGGDTELAESLVVAMRDGALGCLRHPLGRSFEMR